MYSEHSGFSGVSTFLIFLIAIDELFTLFRRAWTNSSSLLNELYATSYAWLMFSIDAKKSKTRLLHRM
jgi:hypothetical protein